MFSSFLDTLQIDVSDIVNFLSVQVSEVENKVVSLSGVVINLNNDESCKTYFFCWSV